MCRDDSEYTNLFLLQCFLFLKERQVLMNKIRDIESSVIDKNENSLCYALFGKESMNIGENIHILNATIEYLLSTEINVPLKKSKPLQLITTTTMNDSIFLSSTSPFSFSLSIPLIPRYTQIILYLDTVFVCVCHFLYILFLFCMYLCNCSNCTCV